MAERVISSLPIPSRFTTNLRSNIMIKLFRFGHLLTSFPKDNTFILELITEEIEEEVARLID